MIRSISYLILLAAFICSCSQEHPEATRTVPLSPFASMEIKSFFSVYLVQDTYYAVEIVGRDDLISHVDASIEGDVLVLADRSRGKWMHPGSNKIKVYVHSPRHGTVNAYAAYALRSVNAITSDLDIVNHPEVRYSEIDVILNNDHFSYWNNYSCNGKLTLRGECNSFEINTYALHSVNAADLRAQSGWVTTYAKGDCDVRVVGQLKCSIHGQGNIYVHGSPAEVIVEEQTSTGKVVWVP
jgi:hypothetical protein